MDWSRVGRRLVRLLVLVAAVAFLGVAVSWSLSGELTRAAVLLWLGISALLLVVGAVLVVSVSAWRGMLRAGDRGERLGSDVGLLPPQIRSGSRERGGDDR